ncbi:hypothetical protein ABZT08_33280, partial [Streptomyces sp. NPDC005526]|uniref:hypothetical protein n=1 Tax=Streptomyces sp. NPDC005526 TaxID=3156885 RepID=UPI0033B5B5A6
RYFADESLARRSASSRPGASRLRLFLLYSRAAGDKRSDIPGVVKQDRDRANEVCQAQAQYRHEYFRGQIGVREKMVAKTLAIFIHE